MKKALTFFISLILCFPIFAQKLDGIDAEVYTLSYPLQPLEGQTYRIVANGLGVVEPYGVNLSVIESYFNKTEKMKYTQETESDYVVNIWFDSPVIANQKVVAEGRDPVTYVAYAECIIPLEMSIINKNGETIIPRHLTYQPVKFNGGEGNSDIAAKNAFAKNLKENRNKIITTNLTKALEATLFEFQNNYDLYALKKKNRFYFFKITKKFTDDSWEQMAQTIEKVCLKVLPGQTLANYRDEIMPVIQFYDKKLVEYDQDPKENEDYIIPCFLNSTYLYLLMGDFDSVMKYKKYENNSPSFLWRFSNNMRDYEKYIKDYNARYDLYKSGKTIDAERIEISKKIAREDSLANKPSLVKIYDKSNNSLEGYAYVNVYRPYIKRESSNIIDLSFGRYIDYCGLNKDYKVISRVMADDVSKVVAGDEIFYPVKTDDGKHAKFAYLIYESPKIRVLAFQSSIILLKANAESGESFSLPLFGVRKRLAEFFADDAELSQKIKKKEIETDSRNDLLKLAKLYSEEK